MPITHNIAELRRGLDNATRRQIPSAVSVVVKRTLADVKKNTDKQMMRVLDNPTPFTKRAFKLWRSSKRRGGRYGRLLCGKLYELLIGPSDFYTFPK